MTTVAFLGTAHIHTSDFLKIAKGRTDIVIGGIWDHDAARGQKAADEVGTRFVPDVTAILADSKISAVIVCSETARHHDLALAAVAAKKDLFVEKPLGYSATDAWVMADAVEEAGVKFQTGYFQGGLPAHRYLKDRIDEGVFGKITRVRASNCHAGALGGWFDGEFGWMADPKIAGCGGFGDMATHALDILIWMFGDVASATGALGFGTGRYENCEESGEAILKFKSGVIGTLAAGWDDVANPVSLIISGTEAHAAVISGQVFITSKKLNSDGLNPVTALPAPQPAGFEAFLEAVTGNEAMLVTAREAAYRNAVMDAIYAGARSDTWATPTSRPRTVVQTDKLL